MNKTKNQLGQYVLAADKGMTLTNGEIYTKIYISNEDINESDWSEVDESAVPKEEETATEQDYINALKRLGVSDDA